MNRSRLPPARPRLDESGVFRIQKRRITVRRGSPRRSPTPVVASPVELPKAEPCVEPLTVLVYLAALVFAGSWFVIAHAFN